MNISEFCCMFSLQLSTICVQLHSCHLCLFLHVWYIHIESMTKELESKMCNFSSFWVVVRTEELKFQKFLFSWIPLLNTIILRCNKPILLRKLWAIEYFWVLLLVLITIFYDFCSVTFMSSVHISSCVIYRYRKYD